MSKKGKVGRPLGLILRICRNGHDKDVVGRTKQGRCLLCARISARKRYLKNKGKKKKYQQEHKEEIKLKKHLNYLAKREEKLRKQKEWYEKHKEQYTEYNKKYRKEHPEVQKRAGLKNQTNRGLRVVLWGQEGVREFYKCCPKNKLVDHYIPLQGKLISGLHVIWNLQYLTSKQNSKKKNKCNLLEASEWYGKLLKEAGLK